MPLLTCPSDATRHIRSAIRSRTAWVFATDAQHVARGLSALVMSLQLGGASEAELGFASFPFLIPRTYQRANVTLLTVPKSRLAVADVRRFIGLYAAPPATMGDGDIVPLGTDPDALLMVLSALLDGNVQAITDTTAN